jgi:hypothetical protein
MTIPKKPLSTKLLIFRRFDLILLVILLHLVALMFCRSILLDSLLYTVDLEYGYVEETDLRESVIDYVYDDFLYVVTAHHLYKIDPSEPISIDKIPLPLRFNYLLLKDREIMLIATGEIIILDRENLAYKSGIGIEQGDYRPMVKDQSFAAASGKNHIYLTNDIGNRSNIRILNLTSGRIVKRMSIERILSFQYDSIGKTFTGLDTKNNLLVYDLAMNRRQKISLAFEAQACSNHPDGFLVCSGQGTFLLSRTGRLIDFQPLPVTYGHRGSLFWTNDVIVELDETVLRTQGWLRNDQSIVRLFSTYDSNHDIGTDAQSNLYLMNRDPLNVSRLAKSRTPLQEATPRLAGVDSLWYLQIGAFYSPANALRRHDELRRNGIPVVIDSTDLYRVKFGGFTDKLAALDVTEKMNLEGWFVYEHKMLTNGSEEFYAGSDRYCIRDGVVKKE